MEPMGEVTGRKLRGIAGGEATSRWVFVVESSLKIGVWYFMKL